MFDEYTANLENLKRNYGYMEENKRELKKDINYLCNDY